MFEDLVKSSGINGHQQAVTIINGAPLKWQCNNPTGAQGAEYPTEFAKKTHDVFVMTEAVPLKAHLKWSQTFDYASLFHDLAQTNVPNCQTYIYETWHCTKSGKPEGCEYDENSNEPWRSRLTTYLPLWESIADEVNKTTTGPDMLIIPAGQCMAKLHDEVKAGKFLPEYDEIEDFYQDDIHLTETGNYFVALVMYASIYKTSPVGLTNETKNKYGNPYKAPSAKHAQLMQEIVWNTVCIYPRSGVNCSGVSATTDTNINSNVTVFPNPAYDNLTIKGDKNISFVSIYPIVGNPIIEANISHTSAVINITTLNKGMYFLNISQGDSKQVIKFIKQ